MMAEPVAVYGRLPDRIMCWDHASIKLSFKVLPWRLNLSVIFFYFFPWLIKFKIKSNKFVYNFMIFMSDAHGPVVDCKPGQIMAQFFATRGELTVLVS